MTWSGGLLVLGFVLGVAVFIGLAVLYGAIKGMR